jgi:hypothetical protein
MSEEKLFCLTALLHAYAVEPATAMLLKLQCCRLLLLEQLCVHHWVG